MGDDLKKLMGKLKGKEKKKEEKPVEEEKVEEPTEEPKEEDLIEAEEETPQETSEDAEKSEEEQEEEAQKLIETEVSLLQNNGVYRREILGVLRELVDVHKVNTQTLLDLKELLGGLTDAKK